MNPSVAVWSRRFALVASLLVIALASCRRPSPLEFTVTFKDARSLSPGQAVKLNGVGIGEVTSVSLDNAGNVRVGARIEPKHAAKVFRRSVFTIEKPGGLMDVSGERCLKVTNESSGGTPMKAGDVVRGSEGLLGDLFSKAKDAASAATKWGADAADGLSSGLKALGQSPEVDRFLAAARKQAEEVGKIASDEAGKTYLEKRKALVAEAERLREELEKKAGPEEARRFWTEFQAWIQKNLPETEK